MWVISLVLSSLVGLISVDGVSDIPSTILTLVKWISISGLVLIVILVIVFVYRMAIGNTPDVTGGVSQIMASYPMRFPQGIPNSLPN